MAGAFVALADAEGFLPDSEGAKGLTAGSILTVRITRAAQGRKGPRGRVTGTASVGPPALLSRGPDPIARFAAHYMDAPVVVDDAGLAAGLGLGGRVSVTPLVFDEEVAEAVDALSRPDVQLPGGASLSIWATPALVAIDADAGGALAGPRFRHETLNRTIVPAIAEQIRLRNLSGGIVVDLAGLSPRTRAAFGPDFIAALANDRLRPKFLGFTALGLAEIVRPRVHPPLHELLTGPLAAGLAATRSVMAASNVDPRSVPAIRAHPAVVSALQSDPVALADLRRRTGRCITLRSDSSLQATAWLLETDHG
jgi:hypothetical protein